MDNRNRKKKASNPLGVIFVLVLAFFGMVGENIDNSRQLIVVAAGFVVVAVLIFLGVRLLKKKLAEAKEVDSPFTHSHDRLNKQSADANCSVDEHWKVQLDGFLKAGIIDRKEYAALMERHGRIYDRTNP